MIKILIYGDLLFSIGFIFMISSYLYMYFYLKKHNSLEGFIVYWGVFFPKVVLDYKIYTKKYSGKVGIAFYFFIFSLSIIIVLFIIHSVASLMIGPVNMDTLSKNY